VILTVGTKVIYPCQGPCVIGPVVKKIVDGRPTNFYHLVVLDARGGKLFVPVDKADAMGIRQLLKKSEIPKLLGHLKKAARTANPATTKNWKQRTVDNLKLFTSGSAFDLAKVVELLTDLSETRALSPSEKRTLERARELLVCEISEVMGKTRSAVEEQVNNALKARDKRNEEAGRKRAGKSNRLHLLNRAVVKALSPNRKKQSMWFALGRASEL
jgi:CarD family transcriptional regulator